MIHLFWLLVSMRGRSNFLSFARQGIYNESSYRNNYDKPFDFHHFNQLLIAQSCSEEKIVVFDPSFITKSGKHTSGLGYFWSGSASRAKRGLEIGGFGAVDILNHTCMHLIAKQTIGQKAHASLLDYYADLVVSLAPELQNTSKTLVVDAFFSKEPFVRAVTQSGFELISRLRDDAVLFYPYLGPVAKTRGRPRKFAGRVDIQNPSEEHFKLVVKENDFNAYEAKVYSKALKRWIKLLLVHYLDKKGEFKKAKIYFSTHSQASGTDILIYYRARFQIEFLYRDAKQFTGLEHCQSRKEKRLDFHFNATLTALSIAKAAHHLNKDKNPKSPFSMFNIKTQYFNELLLDRFFCAFGNIPKPAKNNPTYLNLRNFGKIAA